MLANLIFSAFFVSSLWTSYCLVQAESLIDRNSYEAATIVRLFKGYAGKGKINGRVDIRVDEKYSHEQARGLVKLSFEGFHNGLREGQITNSSPIYETGTFYASPRDDTTLVMSDAACRKAERNELLKELELDFAPVELDEEFDHIIGPMRWVHYMANHRHEMIFDNSDGSHHMLHDVPSLRYSTTVKDRSGNKINVLVFFEKLAHLDDQQFHAIPLRIVFTEMMTSIDVYPIKFSSPGEETFGRRPLVSDEPQLDDFVVKPVAGCSVLLGEANKKTLFGSGNREHGAKSQFSFRAHVRKLPRGPYSEDFDLAVAFDNRLQMLRADMDSPEHAVMRSMSLFNFFQNSFYHVLKNPRQDGNQLLNHVLNLPAEPLEINGLDGLIGGRTGVEQMRRSGARCASGLLRSNSDSLTSRELWGADEFVYLGRARVRGIRAKVYEAIDTELPRWLESPVDYKDLAKLTGFTTRLTSNKNSPVAGESEKASKLVTLVYLSDEKDDRGGERVLQMEIHQTGPHYEVVYGTRIIQFTDFTWSLASFDTQESSQTNNLFSLADFCAEDSSQEGRVEFLLEQVEAANMTNESPSQALQLFQQPRKRNWAALAALQKDLSAYIELVSDLQTQLIEPPANQASKRPWQLLVNFNVAKRRTYSSSLLFVGRGSRVTGRTWLFRLPNFFQCYMLATHRGGEIHFGWDQEKSRCHLGPKSAERDGDKGQMSFALSQTGRLEIYRVRYEEDPTKAIALDSSGRVEFQFHNSIFLFYMGAKLAPGEEEEKPFALSIKRMKSHGFGTKSKEAQHMDVIEGFGLKPQEGVAPARGEVSNFAECRSICHNEPSCRAFSFCIRGPDAECLISQVDFIAPFLVERLREAKGRDVTVEAGGSKREFHRAPTCSIHNHRYVSHFTTEAKVVQAPHHQRMVAADSIEECARLCFATNLQNSGAHRDNVADTLKQLKGTDGSSETQLWSARLEALRRMANSSRSMFGSTCTSFYFFDKLLVDSLSERDRSGLAGLGGLSENGYCDLHAVRTEDPVEDLFIFSSSISTDIYYIRSPDLYEEEYGLNLRASDLSQEELKAHELAKKTMKKSLPDEVVEKAELLLGLVERGENMQEILAELPYRDGKGLCASMCFMQTTGLWPSCKSFDLVIERASDRMQVKCVFNSISKQEAFANNRLDLIDTSVHEYERWHFEPKAKVQNPLEEIEEADSLMRLFLRPVRGSNGDSLWSRFSVYFVATLGIATGLILSAFARVYLQRRPNDERRFSLGSVAPILDDHMEINEA